MKRDMKKTAEQEAGKIPNGYAMQKTELIELMQFASTDANGAFEALIMAFRYGFVLKQRATKNAPTKR